MGGMGHLYLAVSDSPVNAILGQTAEAAAACSPSPCEERGRERVAASCTVGPQMANAKACASAYASGWAI